MDIFEDLNFLGFIKQKLEEEIDFQEKLIENQRNNFYDKQLDYELCKELHTLEKWKDKVSEYIVKWIVVKRNKELVERIEELKLEVNLLNEEINKIVKERK